ncbi:MAG: undecaprenyl-diphosphate phosphatase [Candidatus Kinetoplastibacterium crithidii]|nr:MAG: undecaprenyl-diphosphate phosphatase [Candidatus Kinetoplastibacterium crithidii]
MFSNFDYFVQTCFLGIVEGITEFIPVSSTAHLIFLGKIIGFHSEESRVFEVFIQAGAMFALLVFFREKIKDLVLGIIYLDSKQILFLRNLLVSITPSVLIGFCFIRTIKDIFNYEIVISISLILGGFIIIIVENNYYSNNHRESSIYKISLKQALFIGLLQCLAMIPGVSRSGATIVAGIVVGLDRRNATEFSFMMAIPTIIGAAVYDVYSNIGLLSSKICIGMSIGFIASYISAMFIVHFVVEFVANHSYKIFGWYRIIIGLLMLLMIMQ